MFCDNCGQKLPDGAKFCTKCGTKSVRAAQQMQPVPPVQPAMAASYQTPMLPPKKKFPIWAIVLLAVAGAVIGIALLGIIVTNISKQNLSSAKEFLQKGDYDAAKGLIEEELNYSYHDSVELYLLLAECYLGKDDYKAALSMLEAAKEDVKDASAIEQKINEIKQDYAVQIEADQKAEALAKKKAEEEAKKKAEEERKKAEEERKKQEEEKKQQEQNAKKEMQNYIQSCQSVAYKDLLRDPDRYKGKKIKITVEIKQILSAGILADGGYRAYEDYDFSVGDTFLQKEWYINGLASESGTKILTDDVVVFYGEFAGMTELKRALTGVKEEIPCFNFKYYSIIQE